jgi:carbon storage regulator
VLVVRRRTGELIRIGSDIELRLLSIGKSSVRLGIEAPRSVAIAVRESEAAVSRANADKNYDNGRSVETSGER